MNNKHDLYAVRVPTSISVTILTTIAVMIGILLYSNWSSKSKGLIDYLRSNRSKNIVKLTLQSRNDSLTKYSHVVEGKDKDNLLSYLSGKNLFGKLPKLNHPVTKMSGVIMVKVSSSDTYMLKYKHLKGLNSSILEFQTYPVNTTYAIFDSKLYYGVSSVESFVQVINNVVEK